MAGRAPTWTVGALDRGVARQERWAKLSSLVKVLCPQCERLVDLTRFRVDAGVLFVSCERCGAESEVRAASDGPGVAAPLASPAPVPSARVEPDLLAASAAPRPAAHGRPASQPPRVSLTSSPTASNVVMLRTAGVEAVERAARAAEGDPFEVPPGHCPKCLAPRDEAPACRQCGVHFEYFQPEAVAPPAWLREAWLSLLRDWGNEKAHEDVRRRAQRDDALTPLGRLYRLRQVAEPNDPIAEKGRADVLRLAAAPMTFRTRDEAPEPGRAKVVVAGVVVLFCLGAVGLLIRYIVTLVP